jgi:hypothetical protein
LALSKQTGLLENKVLEDYKINVEVIDLSQQNWMRVPSFATLGGRARLTTSHELILSIKSLQLD